MGSSSKRKIAMQVCIETMVSGDGSVELKNVPFSPGEIVEVVVRSRETDAEKTLYPFRGKPIEYAAPFDSVAQEDWDASK
jgi:subtilisin-like proprotein convertase family protein